MIVKENLEEPVSNSLKESLKAIRAKI